MRTTQHLVVLGLGSVGLPLAIRAVDMGFDVTAVDIDGGRIRQLRQGESYIEDISSERLASAQATGRLRTVTRLPDDHPFDIVVIAVPTPLHKGVPDLSFVEQAARQLGPRLRRGATVVLESTTYPGTTDSLVGPILRETSGLQAGDFYLGYSPERIDPGNPTWGIANTPKLVAGVDEASVRAVRSFYGTLVDKTVTVSSPAIAELSKLLENVFRSVNIALANELLVIGNELGIDVWEAVEAAGTKPY